MGANGELLKALKVIGFTIGLIALDVVLVFAEFSGSRWVFPWLRAANPFIMCLAVALLPLLIFRRSRTIGAGALAMCATFFFITFFVVAFVMEADLGDLFGPIVALLSCGIFIPVLAFITALLQGEWSAFWQLLGELGIAIVAYGLAGWCSRDSSGSS